MICVLQFLLWLKKHFHDLADSFKIASETDRWLSYPKSTSLHWMFSKENSIFLLKNFQGLLTWFLYYEIYIPEHVKVSVQILLHIEGFWKLEVEWQERRHSLSLKEKNFSAVGITQESEYIGIGALLPGQEKVQFSWYPRSGKIDHSRK